MCLPMNFALLGKIVKTRVLCETCRHISLTDMRCVFSDLTPDPSEADGFNKTDRETFALTRVDAERLREGCASSRVV